VIPGIVNYSFARKFQDYRPAEKREGALLLVENIDNSTKRLNQEKPYGFAMKR